MSAFFKASKGPLKKLLIFDGNNYFRRADSIKSYQFMTYRGKQTGAMYGSIKAMLEDIVALRPDEVAVAFDGFGAKAVKQKIYAGYKSRRMSSMDDPLYQQMLETVKILKYAGLCVLHKDYADADDIIGRLTMLKRSCIISSSDKDFLQRVNNRVCLMRHINREKHFWYRDHVMPEFGVKPSQFADYLALVGDAVDDIPGLVGCGPVMATKLLNQFGDVETLVRERHKIEDPRILHLVVSQHKNLLKFKQLTKLDMSVISDTALLAIEKRLVPRAYTDELFPALERWGQRELTQWFKNHTPTVLNKPRGMFA